MRYEEKSQLAAKVLRDDTKKNRQRRKNLFELWLPTDARTSRKEVAELLCKDCNAVLNRKAPDGGAALLTGASKAKLAGCLKIVAGNPRELVVTLL